MHLANIAVINLTRRYDRLAAFMQQAQPVLAGIGTPVTAWAAADDPYEPDRGCLLSHTRLLSTMDGPLLVLEDDACFAPDFTLDLDPPHDWDILWLGGQHRLAPRPHNAAWVVPTYMVRTHAYIARDPADIAARLIGVPRLDPYMSTLPVMQYVLKYHTVGQAAGVSDIDGRVRDHDEYWQLRYRPEFSRP